MFSIIENVQTLGLAGALADRGVVLFFIAAQVLIMIFMIFVSIYKPAAKKKDAKLGQFES